MFTPEFWKNVVIVTVLIGIFYAYLWRTRCLSDNEKLVMIQFWKQLQNLKTVLFRICTYMIAVIVVVLFWLILFLFIT